MGDFSLDHIATAYSRKPVGIGPVLGLVFDINVEFARLERFEGNVAVTVKLHFDPVEIVFTAIDRQVGAPPVFDMFKHQLSAWGHLGDAIRPAAQRWLERCRFKVAFRPVVLWQNRQFPQPQNQ